MAVTTFTTPHPKPQRLNPRDYRGVVFLKNKIDQSVHTTTLPASLMPNNGERARLTKKRDELAVALRGAGAEAIHSDVFSLFATMAVRSMGEDDATLILRLYLADLSHLPKFAIEAACADFRQKRCGDGHWTPTPGEIRERALQHMRPYQKDLADLNAVLAARARPDPPTGEQRLAAIEREKGVLAAMRLAAAEGVKQDGGGLARDGAADGRDKIATIREAEAALAARAYATTPCTISAALAARFSER